MKKLAVFALTICLISSALAEDKKTETKETTNKVETKQNLDKYKRVVLDESMANRDGKKYTVNANITGVHFGSPSTGLEVGYHLDTNTVIGLQAVTLQGDEDLYDDDDNERDRVWSTDGKGSAINLSVKKFTSNSFYIKPGVYYRQQTRVKSVSSAWNSTTDTWSVVDKEVSDYTDMGITFAIGNQWQWENFTLGCDWIGISRSLSVLEKNGAKMAQNDLNSGNGLNFYLGYTF